MGVTNTDRRRAIAAALLALLFGGCHEPALAPAGTGAQETAEAFFQALIRKDWGAAYETLHPDSRRGLDVNRFAELARAHRQEWAFEPGSLAVRSCEEHDGVALAHVNIIAAAPDSHQHHRDAISLHRSKDSWRIILPPGFGRRS
jgi:hypothetical protein